MIIATGEAGVGKTTVIRRFCDECALTAHVTWGACDSLFTPRPLGPFLEVGHAMGGTLQRALEDEAGPHDVVAGLVHELGRHEPGILVLEDVHWADEATLDVLRLLTRRLQRLPTLVVASLREDELHPRHPLRITLGELATSRDVRRIRLEPLSLAAVSRLAEPLGVDPAERVPENRGQSLLRGRDPRLGGYADPRHAAGRRARTLLRLASPARALLDAVATVPPRAEAWLLNELSAHSLEALEDCLASGMVTLRPRRRGVSDTSWLDSPSTRRSRPIVDSSSTVALSPRSSIHRRGRPMPPCWPTTQRPQATGRPSCGSRPQPRSRRRCSGPTGRLQDSTPVSFGARRGCPRTIEGRSPPAPVRGCFTADQYDVGISALEEALALCRLTGSRSSEGDVLRRLSEFLWCPGRTAEAGARAQEAVTLLETLPRSRELGLAYANLASLHLFASFPDEALAHARRALELGEQLGNEEIAIDALATIGSCDSESGALDLSLERARRTGQLKRVVRALNARAAIAVEGHRYDAASADITEALRLCDERGYDLFRLYLLAHRARVELDLGRWADAAETATAVLRVPRTSTTPRIQALVVLGLVRARRGDPGAQELLDEAFGLARPTAELFRMAPVAAGRAEAAWLRGDRDGVDEATSATLELALERGHSSVAGQLACWRLRAGLDRRAAVPDAPEPWDAELGGRPASAADRWAVFGCSYDSALALAGSDDEASLRRAHAILRELDAPPATAIVARRLREVGARGIPRGPARARAATPPA